VSIIAHSLSPNRVQFTFSSSVGVIQEFVAGIIPPSGVYRSTGTFRAPESMIGLSSQLVAELVGMQLPAAGGRVIALVVHTVSRRAAAIGVFADAAAAGTWWFQPFNRLARDRDVLFLPVPIDVACS